MFGTMLRIAIGSAVIAAALPAQGGTVSRAPFGMADGHAVEAITLANAHGMRVTLISYGASIQSVIVPDRRGHPADVALGYPTLRGYLEQPQYFGATVGRVANRIARGRFTLDGRAYQTPLNNGSNSLHGGTKGFDKRVWTVTRIGTDPHGAAMAAMKLVSADGDQGYPGMLTATATYTLREDNSLRVEYGATTDKPTVVNLSNHAYWNLGGEGSDRGVMDHLLTIPADNFTPTDSGAIPTGEVRPVEGTVFDFRRATPIGARVRAAAEEQIRFGRGYDHNWVIARDVAVEPRLVARVEDPVSGRVLEVLSDQPGLQFYSGNFLDATSSGKANKLYREGDAFVLEPQKFPDTVNRPAFGSVRLDPGQEYRNRITFRFSTVGR
jgi:aldose 1-epimerase